MLERINKSNDIKKLNLNEKKILCNEIRNYLIEVVSENGGHLASNLGVVELTIALESVFDVTRDKIVWDVGHQCYVHKILNNRKNLFKTLRKIDGISGFPKIGEDLSDCFNTGHSSTSISAAFGIACARDIKKENYYSIAVIGDGALTGGMAMEALNHVGNSNKNLIVVLNDNEMSISKNIGGINKLLTKLRVKSNYRKTNSKGKKVISNIPIIGSSITSGISKIKNSIKQLIIPGMYFEEIGFKYLGPVDGHNIEDMESLFLKAKNIDGPILIHVLTKKGKGYKYSEENPSKFHGIGKFNIEDGTLKKLKKDDYSSIFGKKITSLAEKNNKIVGITAAMKDGTGFDLFSKTFPDRFFDVGIAEQHAITFAAGLATNGMIPFVSIYSSFYQRCYDQVIHDVCMQNLPVIMCIDRAGLVGEDGETHQGIFDLSFMNIIPNLTILAPASFKELESMMDYAVKLNKPVVIRYPRGGEGINNIPFKKITNNKCQIIKEGNDLTIVSIGKSVDKAIELDKLLNKKNIYSDIINVRCLKPIDEKSILKSISKTKNVIVLEDNISFGGLTSIIENIIIKNKLNIKIKSYGYPNVFINHGSIDEIEQLYKLDIKNIYKDIIKKG